MNAASSAPAIDERAWTGSGSRSRLRPEAVPLPAVLLAAIAVGVVVAGGVLYWPNWFALFSAYNVLAFALAGMLWLKRRPRSLIGPLLLGVSVICMVTAFQGSSSSLPFSIGVLADPFAAGLGWYLYLSFPSGRLTRPGIAVWSIGVATGVLGFAPKFFLSEHVQGATPLARCTPACPTNALMIANRPDIAGHFSTAQGLLATTFSFAAVALLLARLVLASPPRRRALAPIVVAGIVWFGSFAAYQIAMHFDVSNARFWSTIGWVLTGARVALPLAFLLALGLAQVYAGGALEQMMTLLRLRPSHAELEHVTADALGDPTFRLELWSTLAQRWIGTRDAAQQPVPEIERGRLELRSEGHPVARLSYDNALDEDPELIDAASSAILFSLDTARLDAEKREVTSQLHEAQRRATTAGLTERRRLERDLHDGAQQQLIAMRIQLGLMTDRAGQNGMSEELAELGRELDGALDEIRAIAHTTYPVFLREGGIGAALAQAASGDLRVQFDCAAARRHPEDVEVAVYFSALEALQNACKHCPLESEIRVRVWDDEALHFEVTDNGPGFDPSTVPSTGGLAGIGDRMATVGGTLTIESTPGRGTRIAGTAGGP